MTPFGKHPELLVWEEEPFNAEPPLELLRREWVTPRELFFARNHAPVPQIDAGQYRLEVGGMVQHPLSLSLDEVRERFPRRQVTATLQCAGNRRQELIDLASIPGEVPWREGAVGNAEWTGAPLRELLRAAGIKGAAEHVAFQGLDEVRKPERTFGLGGSLPLSKAMQKEVLVAYEMNGEPLTPEHGFPLRMVVPGYIGARSVKWVGSITAQAEPSDNYYQVHSYKLFPPEVRPETADWSQGEMLGELGVNSVICRPRVGETLPAGRVLVQGYALAGGDCRLARVELSRDGGRIWEPAPLVGKNEPWAWCFWEASLEAVPGPCEILVRAWDSEGNGQPESLESAWNFKGYMNNGWHRVRARIGTD